MCVMYVWLCLHICDPPHSLHLPFSRLWWQMPEPLHTLHWLSEAFLALNPAAVMLTQCALGCMRVSVFICDVCMVMLAYLRPGTLLPRSLDTVVGADAGAPAYLALTCSCRRLRWLYSHICDPPLSLHWLLTRLWGQMPAPPHTLH